MNYRTLLFGAASILYSFNSWSEESSFTAELGIGTNYLDRGIRLGEGTLHPSVEFNRGDFYAGIWSALPIENKGGPDFFEDQYDFYAGYGWAWGSKTTINLGATFSRFSETSDSFEPYIGISKEMGTLTPSLYIFNDLDLDTWTIEVSTDVVLPLEIIPFETRIYAGRVEADGSGDYGYFGADLIYPIELSNSTTLSLGLHYSDNDIGFGVADNHLYGSASLAITF